MKRSAIIFLSLTLALCAVFVFSAAKVFSFSDNVSYLVNDLYGSRSEVEDVRIDLTAQLHDRHFWNTSIALGAEPKAETDYRFYYDAQYEPYTRYDTVVEMNIETYYDYEYLIDSDTNREQILSLDYRTPFMDLAAKVKGGEEKTETFYYKDYYEYYPINVVVGLGAYNVYGTDENAILERLDMVSYGTEPDIRVFAEIFKIPVLENDAIQLTIGRDIYTGNINHIGSSSGLAGTDGYNMSTQSIASDNAAYFYIDAHTRDGNLVDTSQLGLDFGIYILPYEISTSGKVEIYYEKIATFYPMDPAANLYEMQFSPDGEKLLVTTLEDGVVYLTVLDLDSGEMLQKLEIGSSEWIDSQFVYDDFIVYLLSDSRIALAALLPDGSYEMRFTVTQNLDQLGGYESYGAFFPKDQNVMAYNGGKLVIAEALVDRFASYYDNCSFFVAVFDETGLLYFGEYISTLTADYYGGEAYRNLCRARDISITFE